MAGEGKVVGKVSIKVIPKTKGFRRKVERDLAKLRDLEVDVSPSGLKEFRNKVKTATKGLEAKVGVDLNASELATKTRLAAKAASGRDVVFDAVLKMDKLKYSLQRVAKQKEAKVRVRTVVDQANLEAQIAALKARLAKDTVHHVKIKVKSDQVSKTTKAFGALTSSSKRAWSALGSIGSAAKSAAPKLSQVSAGLKSVGASAKNAIVPLGKFSKVWGKLNTPKERTLGLTQVGWIVAASVAAAAPAVGLLAGAVSALPSLLLAAGAAASVVALGFDGIKDAAGAAAPAIGRLKSALSDKFRERLTPQFQRLNSVIDGTRDGMVRVADGVADFTEGMVDAVSSARGMKNINGILGNTGKLFSKLQPFAHDFTSGLLEIGNAGSETFGYLGDKLNNFGRSFKGAMQELSENGTLQRGIKATYDVLGALGGAIGDIMGAGLREFPALAEGMSSGISRFGKAAAAAMPDLARLSELAGGVLSTAFETLGTVAKRSGDNLLDTFEGLGPGLETAVQGIGSAFGSLSGLVTDFLAGLAPGVGEALGTIGKQFGDLGDTIARHPGLGAALRDIGAGIGDLASHVVDGLFGGQPLITDAEMAQLEKLATEFAPKFDRFIQDMKKNFDELNNLSFENIGSKITDNLRGFAAEMGLDFLATASQKARTNILNARNMMTSSLDEYKAGVTAAMQEAEKSLKINLQPQIEAVDLAKTRGEVERIASETAEVVKESGNSQEPVEAKVTVDPKAEVSPTTDLAANVQSAVEPAKQTLTEAFQNMGTELGATVDTELQAAMTQVDTSINTAAQGIGDSLGTALGGVQIPMEGFTANITSAMSQVSQSITSQVTEIGNTASAELANVVSSMGSEFSGITSVVSGEMENLKSTISSGFAEIPGLATAAISSLPDEVNTKFTEMSTKVLATIDKMISQIEQKLSTIPSRAVAAVGDLSGVLYPSGQALVQGFINGIESKEGELDAAIQRVLSKGRTNFPNSPAKRGPFSGRGYTTHSGHALMRDFAKAMREEEGTVDEAVQDVLSTAQKSFSRMSFTPLGHQIKQVQAPVRESNAKKVAAWRKKDAELVEKFNEDKIKNEETYLKDREKLVERERKLEEDRAKARKDMEESIETPDYGQVDLSVNALGVKGMKSMLTENLAIAWEGAADVAKQGALSMLDAARGVLKSNPELEQLSRAILPALSAAEVAIQTEVFSDAIANVIRTTKFAEIPIDFAIANVDQLRSELGMGDGVVSRAIDEFLGFNLNNSDTQRFKKDQNNNGNVHYHVADMNEAIRLENQRTRKSMMKM